MRVRVAGIDGERITAVLLKEGRQPSLNLGEGIVPAHSQPFVSPAYHRLANAIPVGMQFLEAIGFRADIAVAENILGIPADRDNLAITGDNLQSTGCFTQRTCCVAGLCSGHTAYLLCPKDENPGELLRVGLKRSPLRQATDHQASQ